MKMIRAAPRRKHAANELRDGSNDFDDGSCD